MKTPPEERTSSEVRDMNDAGCFNPRVLRKENFPIKKDTLQYLSLKNVLYFLYILVTNVHK